MITLRQIMAYPVYGYWNGGQKQIFDWIIDGLPRTDNQGQYVRIGSLDANLWFNVAVGKTDKLTLSYAKQHLRAITKGSCAFEYIEE